MQRRPSGGDSETHKVRTTEPGARTQQCFEGPARERAFLASGIVLGPGLRNMNSVLKSRDEDRAVLMKHPD